MDGDAADVDALRRPLRAGARAARARRGARGARARTSTSTPDADVLRVGTCSKTLGALGGFVAGPSRYVELIENSSRPYIFTTAPTPADTAAALAALRVVALTRRRRARRAAARERRPAPARPSVADPAVRVRRGAARDRRRGGAARARARRARDPAADRRARNVAAARRDERRAHRRAGRPAPRRARRGVRRRATPRDASRHDVRRRGRHRHRDRQDVGHRRAGAARCADAASRSRPASRCSRSSPAHAAPTDAEVLGRRDRRGPAHGVPARTAGSPRDGAADGRRGARRARRSRSPSSPPRSRRPRRATRSCSSRASGGVRSPLAADGDTVDARRRAATRRSSCSSPTPSSGTINLVRLSVDALGAAPRRRVPQPLRPGTTSCTRATATGSRRARASRSSPTPRPSRTCVAALRAYWLIRLAGVSDAVLPSSLVTGPIGSVCPAVASYLMNWNVSPTNQSLADVFHFARRDLETDVRHVRQRARRFHHRRPVERLRRSRASSRASAPVVQP